MAEVRFVRGEARLHRTEAEKRGRHPVSKPLYLALALLLGDFGAHRFYAHKWVSGALYLLFCWTLVPLLFALVDFFRGCGEMRDENNRIWI